MNKSLPMIDDNDEVRELTKDDIRLFLPASEVLSRDLLDGLVAIKKQRSERRQTWMNKNAVKNEAGCA